jgi:signal transduction histidine kinase
LERSLAALGDLIDHSLAEIRATAGKTVHSQRFAVSDFIGAVKPAAEQMAQIRECKFTVSPIDGELAVSGDRNLLHAAVESLVQNALRFTRSHTEVTLSAYAVADRILIDVKDHCGGLPAGDAEKMFLPFTQNSPDKSGLGLGLSMTRRSVESSDGTLSVRDVPGIGCIFTINMPRYSMTRTSA